MHVARMLSSCSYILKTRTKSYFYQRKVSKIQKSFFHHSPAFRNFLSIVARTTHENPAEKAATIRRFEYSPLGIELKKQTDIAKKQYQKFDDDVKEATITKHINRLQKVEFPHDVMFKLRRKPGTFML